MFEVVCTGKNPAYGQKGEVRCISDNYLVYALKDGVITEKIKYAGNRATATKVKSNEVLEAPIKRISCLITLDKNLANLNKIERKIEKVRLVMLKLKELILKS